jgi:uncharacterized membrane protein YoaK (UPF0700 family)
MDTLTPIPAAAIAPKPAERDGPLPRLLLVLTFATGLVDAVSYLALGHVFVANMTGNVVLLGFALAGAQDFSVPASLAALAAFLAGAVLGGRLGSRTGDHRGRLLMFGIAAEVLLVGAALVVSTCVADLDAPLVRYGLVALLGLAMGLQNAVARRLAVPDLPTTVLTLTLAGLAADSTLAGGNNPRPARRLMATVTMLLGAAVGAFLVRHAGVVAVLAFALGLLVLNAVAAYRAAASTASWTAGARPLGVASAR